LNLSILNTLSGQSMWAVKEKGSKFFRADPLAAQVQAGNVYLLRGEWNYGFIMQCSEFTGEEGGKDDRVDAASLAFSRIVRLGYLK